LTSDPAGVLSLSSIIFEGDSIENLGSYIRAACDISNHRKKLGHSFIKNLTVIQELGWHNDWHLTTVPGEECWDDVTAAVQAWQEKYHYSFGHSVEKTCLALFQSGTSIKLSTGGLNHTGAMDSVSLILKCDTLNARGTGQAPTKVTKPFVVDLGEYGVKIAKSDPAFNDRVNTGYAIQMDTLDVDDQLPFNLVDLALVESDEDGSGAWPLFSPDAFRWVMATAIPDVLATLRFYGKSPDGFLTYLYKNGRDWAANLRKRGLPLTRANFEFSDKPLLFQEIEGIEGYLYKVPKLFLMPDMVNSYGFTQGALTGHAVHVHANQSASATDVIMAARASVSAAPWIAPKETTTRSGNPIKLGVSLVSDGPVNLRKVQVLSDAGITVQSTKSKVHIEAGILKAKEDILVQAQKTAQLESLVQRTYNNHGFEDHVQQLLLETEAALSIISDEEDVKLKAIKTRSGKGGTTLQALAGHITDETAALQKEKAEHWARGSRIDRWTQHTVSDHETKGTFAPTSGGSQIHVAVNVKAEEIKFWSIGGSVDIIDATNTAVPA
jgi:hypothetical protein